MRYRKLDGISEQLNIPIHPRIRLVRVRYRGGPSKLSRKMIDPAIPLPARTMARRSIKSNWSVPASWVNTVLMRMKPP
jgi:hypothetical protein